MEPFEQSDTSQHRQDKQIYDNWFMKDHCVCFTMLKNMHNNFIEQFENYRTTLEKYLCLKHKVLAINKRPKTCYGLTFSLMNDVIRDLRTTIGELTNEHQVLL